MPEVSDANVVVCGPASWNHLIVLDRLPEPVPHMQFALGDLHTLGGTSAGKGLHLADLGARVTLHALLGDDDEGRSVSAALARAGVRLEVYGSERTERHAPLMTQAGERVSLYLATPSTASVVAVEVDTNGAGDAFFAGFLAAWLSGSELEGCLDAGSHQAVVALSSEHLHPAVAGR